MLAGCHESRRGGYTLGLAGSHSFLLLLYDLTCWFRGSRSSWWVVWWAIGRPSVGHRWATKVCVCFESQEGPMSSAAGHFLKVYFFKQPLTLFPHRRHMCCVNVVL